jgi:hypothetical protein
MFFFLVNMQVVGKDDVAGTPLDAHWLVELSALTTDEGINDTTEEVNSFADYLLPYVLSILTYSYITRRFI